MKRIRSGEIQDSVKFYLKRRQHTTLHGAECKEEKMPRTTRHSMRQMTLNRAILTESSTSNSFSYSSITGDVSSCHQQYAKLKEYVNDAGQPYKSELYDILYPIFIHIFLEMIINGHKAIAHKFFDRFHRQLIDQTHKERHKIIDALRQVHMREDVVNNQLLAAFRENKYVIYMKSESLDYLLRYLKAQENALIMQMFNQYLSMQVKDNNNKVETPHEVWHSKGESPDKRRTSTGDLNVSSLQKCIQRVRNCSPCISSICFYTFINTSQGLCCCSLSHDQKLLCAGFENSAIKVWARTPQLLARRSADDIVDVSELRLSDYDVNRNENVTRTCEMVTMRGHSGPVYRTAFMPDSRYLLSCSEDTTLRLWDMETFTNIVCYRGHNYPVWNLDISSLGYFASCSQDKSIRLWSTDRVFPLRTLVGHGMDVECVRFHPNGNYLASGSDDKTVRLWSVQEGKTVRLMQAHRSSVCAVAFSPDGQQLATAGEDRRIRLWDLSSGQVMKELRGHTDVVYSLVYTQDGAMLASGGLDATVRVWDVKKTPSQNSSHSQANSPELLACFPTKTTSVLHLHYGQYNVLHAAGGAIS